MLLVGSGLMIRTFQQLRRVQPGFTHPEEIQIVHSMIPEAIAKEPERVMRMQHEILRQTRRPSRRHVGGVWQRRTAGIVIWACRQPGLCRGQDASRTGQVPLIRQIRMIAPGFFKTMGTRVIAGSDFTWTDLYDKRHVAIVSENLAREWWGDPRAALGKRIRESGRCRSVARNRGRRRKRLRQRRAREAARVRILAGADGSIHLGRRQRIRRRCRHVRDPLQPDGNGGSAGGGAASHLVRERQAAGVPGHHARRRSTTSPWRGRRSRS